MQQYLTLSFDGGMMKVIDSVYTVHIITVGCHVFLCKGNEASHKSHMGEHLYGVLKLVCELSSTLRNVETHIIAFAGH